ncbi:hypothetical protein EJ110_NYTH05600 [Nymphaea thermarum]|nr:hypothetical protein EJ110_NYTH05600 [Nymphaea thermarum]
MVAANVFPMLDFELLNKIIHYSVAEIFTTKAGDGCGILHSLALGDTEAGRNTNDSILDGITNVCFSGLTHLCQKHGEYLLRSKLLHLTLPEDDDHRSVGIWILHHLERPFIHVALQVGVGKPPPNQALGICNPKEINIRKERTIPTVVLLLWSLA